MVIVSLRSALLLRSIDDRLGALRRGIGCRDQIEFCVSGKDKIPMDSARNKGAYLSRPCKILCMQKLEAEKSKLFSVELLQNPLINALSF